MEPLGSTSTGSAGQVESSSSFSGSGGSTADGGTCPTSTGTIDLGIWDGHMCNPGYPGNEAMLDGVFEPSAGGFHVVGATATVEIPGVLPAIPEGTFVRMSYVCEPGFTFEAGGYVMLENLARFGGAPNPTEDGTRLWYFAVGGAGESSLPAVFPFAVTHDVVCTQKSAASTVTMSSTTVSGEGFSVTAQPAMSTSFTVSSGANAGHYQLDNLDWSHWSPTLPGETEDVTMFRITRAP